MKSVLIVALILCCSLFVLPVNSIAGTNCENICYPIKINQQPIASWIISVCKSTGIGKGGFYNQETGTRIDCDSIYKSVAELGASIYQDCLSRCNKQQTDHENTPDIAKASFFVMHKNKGVQI